MRERGFPPVGDVNAQVLILGSFPSPESLAKKEYYGHRRNHFWKLMGALLDKPLYEMAYLDRLPVLLNNGIALWDVYAQCERAGALDSNIRNEVDNQFQAVLAEKRYLRRVCFNGKMAGRFAPLFAERGLDTLVLPSSSPANTLGFERKLEAWRGVMAGVKKARRVVSRARS